MQDNSLVDGYKSVPLSFEKRGAFIQIKDNEYYIGEYLFFFQQFELTDTLFTDGYKSRSLMCLDRTRKCL